MIITGFALPFFLLLAVFSIKLGLKWEALFWVFMGTVSAIGLVDAVRKRGVILTGGTVYVPASPNIHFRRAQITMSLILIFLGCLAGTVFLIWQTPNGSHSLSVSQLEPLWGVLIFLWVVWFGLYCSVASKRLLLWSDLLQNGNADTDAGSVSLPPMTVRGLAGPVTSMFGFCLSVGIFVGGQNCFSNGRIHVEPILTGLIGGLAGGALVSFLYVGLVAALWAWSNHISRAARQGEIPAEYVWPPPVPAPREQENVDDRG